MVKEKNVFQMEMFMRVTSSMEFLTVRENMFGKKEVDTRVDFVVG